MDWRPNFLSPLTPTFGLGVTISDIGSVGGSDLAEAEEQRRRKRRAEEPSLAFVFYSLSGRDMLVCGLRDSYIHLSID